MPELITSLITIVILIAAGVGGFLFYKKRTKERATKQAEERKVQEELEQKRQEEEAKRPFTLWDYREIPLEWFFSDDAKTIYNECITNSQAMWDTLLETGKTERGNSTATRFDGMRCMFENTCEAPRIRKNWLIVFYYRFMITKYKEHKLDIKNGLYLYPLYALMVVADLRCNDDKNKLFISYPDCLTEDKNPILYYLTRSFQEDIPFIRSLTIQYIYSGLTKAGIDLSKEEWMYDKSFFFTELGYFKSEDTIEKQIRDTVAHPEYLP